MIKIDKNRYKYKIDSIVKNRERYRDINGKVKVDN